MKTIRLILTVAVVSFAAAALQAGENKESKAAGCCAKAAGKGEKCTHECCVEAAKAGNNCEKCKGSGKIEKKEEAKK